MRLIDDALVESLMEEARGSARRRAIYRFHAHEEPVQRMLNAVCPDSYVQPHQHADPDKVEMFYVVRGRLRVMGFDAEGRMSRSVIIQAEGPVRGIEIPPRTWHSLRALDEIAVVLEIIQGPYDAATHKKFAPWAPEEPEAGLSWLEAAYEASAQSQP